MPVTTTKSYTSKFCFDLLCIIAVGIPLAYLQFVGVNPSKRGFFCNDLSIRYPDKKALISTSLVAVISLGIPISCMLITESFHWKYRKNGDTEDQIATLFGLKVHPLLCEFYKKIGIFLFGAFVAHLTIKIGKYSTGILRPYFYTVCQPEFPAGVNCSAGEYITDFICRETDQKKIRDARMSFPSGHASFSSYGMVYVTLYLQSRMTVKFSSFVRPLLQVSFIYVAWFISLSRVSDYKHHWDDVLVGMVIGATSAILVAKYVSDLFAPGNRRGSNTTRH